MRVTLSALLIALVLLAVPVSVQAQDAPVVHAVMFYSSSCTHCQQVLQETLPPLRKTYGSQFDLMLLDVSNRQMAALYDQICALHAISGDLCGAVPTVVVGTEVLIGSDQIAEHLSDLVAQGVQDNGIAFPDIPGMQAAIAYIESFRSAGTQDASTPDASKSTPAPWLLMLLNHPLETGLLIGTLVFLVASPPLWWRAVYRSPGHDWGRRLLAFVLGVLLLVAILLSASLFEPDSLHSPGNLVVGLVIMILVGLAVIVWRAVSQPSHRLVHRLHLAGPLLAMIGLLLSAYMLRSEIGTQLPYCGPLGDCVAVQQSTYAYLFGWLPVGLLGAAGYLSLLITWVVAWLGSRWIKSIASWVVLALLVFGLYFSAYLTILEIFVIRAMCAWCLMSAITLLLMFWSFSALFHATDAKSDPRRHSLNACPESDKPAR